MNNQETTALCRYVRALCPQQKFDEYTPDAWHDVLSDFRLDDAREAASRVGRRQPFVAPAEIAAEIRVLRDQRLEGFVYEPQPEDDNPRAYLTNMRTQREQVADGLRPADPATIRAAITPGQTATRPPLALTAIGRTIPDQEPQPKRGNLAIACPKCSAPVGRHCRWPAGGKRPTHPARVRRAEGTLPDPDADRIAAERRAAAAAALDHLTPEQQTQLDEYRRSLSDTNQEAS